MEDNYFKVLTEGPLENQLIPFPMINRVGKIREVAAKIRSQKTRGHVDYYRKQVTSALDRHLEKIHLSPAEREAQVRVFWQQVERELLRQSQAFPSDPHW